MSNLDLVVKLFCEFLNETKASRLYLGPHTFDNEGNPVYTTYPNNDAPPYVNWQGNDKVESFWKNMLLKMVLILVISIIL